MSVIRSAGAVIFRKTKKGRKYLLLHYPSMSNGRVSKPDNGHWDFPKGQIEKGEKTEEAVRREVAEETGIDEIEILSGFKETIRYFVNYDGRRQLKFVVFFLAKTKQSRIHISWEHQGYMWLPYEDAYTKLTYKNAKEVFKKVHNYLSEKGI